MTDSPDTSSYSLSLSLSSAIKPFPNPGGGGCFCAFLLPPQLHCVPGITNTQHCPTRQNQTHQCEGVRGAGYQIQGLVHARESL